MTLADLIKSLEDGTLRIVPAEADDEMLHAGMAYADRWLMEGHSLALSEFYEAMVKRSPDNTRLLLDSHKAMKAALEFYADPKNWVDTPSYDGDPECFTPKAIPVTRDDGNPCDCGDTARSALQSVNSPEKPDV